VRDTRRGVWRIWALLAIIALVFAACGDSGGDDEEADGGGQETETEDKKTGGTVIFAAEQEPESLNWQTAAHNTAWGAYIMGAVWPGTYNVAPDGEKFLNEDLIESRELTDEDPQTVVYKINPEAEWSDGKPISADDFIFYWESQNGKNPAYLPASTTGYEDIESVVGSDNGKTVTVKFAKKFADWEALFDYLYPVHAFEAAGGGDKIKGFNEGFVTQTYQVSNFVSGGQYTVTELKPGQSITLSRNESYYGEPGFLDKIIVPFITDGAQQPAALENKEADIAFPQAQIDLVKQLQGIQGVTADVGFGTFWEHLDFNFENAHLGVKEVRLALGKAIDREAVVERLPKQVSDEAQVLNNRIYKPSQEDFEDHGSKEFGERDVEGAQELLEKAGYAKGADGIYAKGGQKLTLRIVWREPNDRRQQTATLLQSQLKEAGIDAQLSPRPDFTFLDKGDFDIALFGWTGGTVLSSTTSIYEPDGGQNHAGHNNPRIGELYEQANTELDADKRADLMNQIDEILWEDLPTLPLYQVPEVLAFRDTIDGPEYNGFGGPGWNMHLWSMK
jgi:peptide/nickel transport system substrate-binding protein